MPQKDKEKPCYSCGGKGFFKLGLEKKSCDMCLLPAPTLIGVYTSLNKKIKENIQSISEKLVKKDVKALHDNAEALRSMKEEFEKSEYGERRKLVNETLKEKCEHPNIQRVFSGGSDSSGLPACQDCDVIIYKNENVVSTCLYNNKITKEKKAEIAEAFGMERIEIGQKVKHKSILKIGVLKAIAQESCLVIYSDGTFGTYPCKDLIPDMKNNTPSSSRHACPDNCIFGKENCPVVESYESSDYKLCQPNCPGYIIGGYKKTGLFKMEIQKFPCPACETKNTTFISGRVFDTDSPSSSLPENGQQNIEGWREYLKKDTAIYYGRVMCGPDNPMISVKDAIKLLQSAREELIDEIVSMGEEMKEAKLCNCKCSEERAVTDYQKKIQSLKV